MSVNSQQETLNFQAEVKQLLHLVTHSLYSHREIFLRELISNASDAADKLRYEALSDDALFEGDSSLKIQIKFDQVKKTLTIIDNGIGMSREEVINNLGTIAKSGTREYIESLNKADKKNTNLIGQFGVGFYSAFVVAKQVDVYTRRAGVQADLGVFWSSKGDGEFEIKNIERAARGTEIVLHLKDDAEEFLDEYRLKNIINKYSDHIVLPILMDVKKDDKVEAEQINKATALWTLPRNKIKKEEYNELYKHISHDFEDALTWTHNKVEGKLEYTLLLYIPQRPPFDLFNREQKHGLKLYAQRVFVMDDAEQLLPMYLRFVRGVVDSNDLPLNVSREILQNNSVIETIKTACVKRILETLENLASNDKEKYAKFWKSFGQVLKEGVVEDPTNKEKIAGLLRFASTLDETETQKTSLQDYIERMQKNQENIYYITAESYLAAKSSPHLEAFRKKGIEVLILTDHIDEWLTSYLQEFNGKKLQSIAKSNVDISNIGEQTEKKDEKIKEQQSKDFESMLAQMKKVLGETAKDVKLTDRLTDSPACLIADENDMSLHLKQLMQQAGQAVPTTAPILEINPEHPLIDKLKTETDDERFGKLTQVLFDQALLAEGGKLQNPAEFVKRINELLIV